MKTLKVLLVDDEVIFLEFMSQCIDWSAHGCEVVGCAKNGIEALDLVEKSCPDILFVDINMPLLNGLDLAKKLKELGICPKIVIMTAHDEFTYAQQAIKLNVVDYLLKPFNGEGVIAAIARCQEEICVENDAVKMQQESALRALLYLEKDQVMSEGFVLPKQKVMVVAALKTRRNLHIDRDTVLSILEHAFAPYPIEHYFLGAEYNRILMVHQVACNVNIEQVLCTGYQCIIERHPECFSFVGIGDIVNAPQTLSRSYKTASMMVENHIKFEKKVVGYWDFAQDNWNTTRYTIADILLLIKYFSQQEYKKADKQVEKIFALSSDAYFSSQYVVAAYHSLLLALYEQGSDTKSDVLREYTDTQDLLKRDINLCASLDQVKGVVQNYVYEALSDKIQIKNSTKKDVLVEKITAFLYEHFSEHNLTVEQIASRLFFESSYLRRVYKMQTNKTIMQKLEEIRIEHVKGILATRPKVKMADVAEEVGFSDQYYFSKRFKLYCGVSPSEYQVLLQKNKEAQ